MTAKITPLELAEWLLEHPELVEAHIEQTDRGDKIVAGYDPAKWVDTKAFPVPPRSIPIDFHPTTRITHLRLQLPSLYERSPFNECQDEPIQLGTQIQPFGRAWVGTAGSPIHWRGPGGVHRYGFLTNWHVLPGGDLVEGHTVHQPDTAHSTMAYLANWSPVDRDVVNTVDAAIADTLVEGFHTTDSSIVAIGPLDPEPLDATVGLQVRKAGRTTGLTAGTCRQTGAAVRVDYGNFTAVFADQDIFDSHTPPFSAPGDSGSLIVCHDHHRPVALLFAGGGNLTVGNPIGHVISALSIDFVYP